jgi:hypothetical protein
METVFSQPIANRSTVNLESLGHVGYVPSTVPHQSQELFAFDLSPLPCSPHNWVRIDKNKLCLRFSDFEAGRERGEGLEDTSEFN